ncbi:SwmB domain-containing protein [Pseudomonas sp. DSP3-2-2]|uniref:SwmB domain-containing protein n=1 Tax=unclassified Pseudomonas TaxID=196821 RepID=UPI003CEBD26E
MLRLPAWVAVLVIDATAKTATLTLTTPVTAGQSVTVAYNDPTVGNDINALQNAAGTDAASFSATAVTNNTAFVTQLYQNAFGRAPDATRLAFHVAQLAKNPGATGLASVIADFVDSPEMAIKLAGVVDQGIALYA